MHKFRCELVCFIYVYIRICNSKIFVSSCSNYKEFLRSSYFFLSLSGKRKQTYKSNPATDETITGDEFPEIENWQYRGRMGKFTHVYEHKAKK